MANHEDLFRLICLLFAAFVQNINEISTLYALELFSSNKERDLYVMPRPNDCWLDYVLFNEDLNQAEHYFREKLRMSRKTFFALLNKCGPKLVRKNTNLKSCLPPHKVLAIGLYRLSHGTSHSVTSNVFNVGKTTSEEAFKDVISVLKPLKEDFIKFPKSVSEKQSVIAGLDKISKIKNIIGAIDGTHYCMQKPTMNAKDYWSRYSRYDVACQAVCDSECRFLHFACIYPGSMHDARIFELSDLESIVQEGLQRPLYYYGNRPVAPFLLGDSAYPLSSSLIKPYSDMSFDPKERHFNKELSRARVKIENAFGILNSRFRILKTVLSDKLSMISDIILCCAILHNICLANADSWEEDLDLDGLDNATNQCEHQNDDTSGENLSSFLKEFIYEN